MSSCGEESFSSSSTNEGSQSGGEGCPQSSSSSKAASVSYSGAVAQRVLFGSYYKRRVGGRRMMGSKSAPSRLSKVSAADNSSS